MNLFFILLGRKFIFKQVMTYFLIINFCEKHSSDTSVSIPPEIQENVVFQILVLVRS